MGLKTTGAAFRKRVLCVCVYLMNMRITFKLFLEYIDKNIIMLVIQFPSFALSQQDYRAYP